MEPAELYLEAEGQGLLTAASLEPGLLVLDFQYLSYSRQLTINFASDLDAIFYQLKVPLFPLVVAIKTCTMCTPIDAKT